MAIYISCSSCTFAAEKSCLTVIYNHKAAFSGNWAALFDLRVICSLLHIMSPHANIL